MKIPPISTNLNNFRKINNQRQETGINPKSYAQVSDLKHMQYTIPSFTALSPLKIQEIPQAVLEGIEEEFSHSRILQLKEVPLFNKLEQKLEQAFLVKLGHGDEVPQNGLMIFDREGNVISRIHELDYAEEEGYLRPSNFCTTQKDKYKGAGKLLIQACVEDSLNNGCGGKLYAKVSNNRDHAVELKYRQIKPLGLE